MPTESCSCWKLNGYLSHQNAVVVVVYPPPCSGTTTLKSDTYNKSLKTTLNSRISHKYNNKRTTPLIDTFLDRKKTVRLSTTLSLSFSVPGFSCSDCSFAIFGFGFPINKHHENFVFKVWFFIC